MKKYILVTVLISSLLLASCGKKETVETPNKVDQTITTQETTWEKAVETNNEEVNDEKVNSTMMEIFKKWKPTTCTFKTTDEQWKVYDAIMYIDWKNMRYTMMWEIDWKKFENNVIIKDWYTYNWSNMALGWLKMKQNLDENNNNQEKSDGSTKDMNKTLEFDCKSWVDKAEFELPKDIEFQEFDMPSIPEIPAA